MQASFGEAMIGIILVTHGNLAQAFLAVLEELQGHQPGIKAISIGINDKASQSELLETVAAVDGGNGVVLLTDLFGGTPCNLAISVMGQSQVEVISGLNLPLLIKLASLRDQPLTQAVQAACQTGRESIEAMSAQLAPLSRIAAGKRPR